MIYTKNQVKKMLEKDKYNIKLTIEDIMDCAKDWGLYKDPQEKPWGVVLYEVLKASVGNSKVADSLAPSFPLFYFMQSRKV